MLRLIFVTIVSLPLVINFIFADFVFRVRGNKVSEFERYNFVRKMVKILKRNARIRTNAFGLENLPDAGVGYVMYPNHQGKYDTLGIIDAHKTPCTVMIDKQRGRLLMANQLVSILKGSRLDKRNIKNQIEVIHTVTDEVKSGRKYIIFPEGGYKDNKNNVQDFLPGAFKSAMRAHSPIVPVALIDSYKPFFYNSIRRVTTQVHFLKPLFYEEYKDLTSSQIAQEVRRRIVDKIGQFA